MGMEDGTRYSMEMDGMDMDMDGYKDGIEWRLTFQADKTAAVNPMKELRIEKLVISAFRWVWRRDH